MIRLYKKSRTPLHRSLEYLINNGLTNTKIKTFKEDQNRQIMG